MGEGNGTAEEKEEDRHPPHAREVPSNFSAVVAPVSERCYNGTTSSNCDVRAATYLTLRP